MSVCTPHGLCGVRASPCGLRVTLGCLCGLRIKKFAVLLLFNIGYVIYVLGWFFDANSMAVSIL
jgi:hypothetical protein